jgi:hypothetical protein
MLKRTKLMAAGSVAATVLVAAGLAGSVVPAASAAIPPATAGNVTVLAGAPRLVKSPGTALNAGQIVKFTVAGKSFGGVAIPANTTGVVLSITATNPQAAGRLTAWTAEGGQPGTPTVSYVKGQSATSLAFVGLNDAGAFNLFSSAKASALISIQSYVTPVAPVTPPPAPTVKTVAAVASKTIQVGGSIRTRATEFASITLPAGTWDARVLGGFTGLNNVNNTVPAGVSLTGTMIVQKGETMGDDFQNNVTVGGIVIPRAQSNTLTQDPTAQLTTYITLPTETKLYLKFFAYASDSSTAGSGELQANLQGATFVKVS